MGEEGRLDASDEGVDGVAELTDDEQDVYPDTDERGESDRGGDPIEDGGYEDDGGKTVEGKAVDSR